MRRIRTAKEGGTTARRRGGKRGTARPVTPPLAASLVQRLIAGVLRRERRRARISVTFLGPTRMRRLNREWKGHDVPTDVISFALPEPDGSLVGDVYICPSVARGNAKAAAVSLREELIRLVVHGTLHVLGYDHPAGPGRTRSAMWRRQERYVKALA